MSLFMIIDDYLTTYGLGWMHIVQQTSILIHTKIIYSHVISNYWLKCIIKKHHYYILENII